MTGCVTRFSQPLVHASCSFRGTEDGLVKPPETVQVVNVLSEPSVTGYASPVTN